VEIPIAEIVRQTIREVGYTDPADGFAADTCNIIVALHGQSPDIARGVEPSGIVGDAVEQIGAGDQGMMVGFACNETPEYMPTPISLAHKLVRELTAARRSGRLAFLKCLSVNWFSASQSHISFMPHPTDIGAIVGSDAAPDRYAGDEMERVSTLA